MTAKEVACHLLQTCKTLHKFEVFMFGSSLYGIGSDYDILIVAPPNEDLLYLKAELHLAGYTLPLDILFMLPEEVEFTNFIVKQKCISFFELMTT